MSWNPEQYHLFSDHRLRPALDLLSQVQLASPMTIYDLGCGTGNVTAILSQRWNSAIVAGVDSLKLPEKSILLWSGCKAKLQILRLPVKAI